MTLYPPYNKTTVKIEKPTEFYDFLSNNIGYRGTSQKYVGKITNEGFKAEINPMHYNSGRPVIRGKFEKGKDDYLTIYLENNNILPIFSLLFISLIVITGIIKQSIFVIPIIIVTLLFFFFMFWILYKVDLRKTKYEMDFIIKKAIGEEIMDKL